MATQKKYHTVNTMDKRNSIRMGLVGCVSCCKSTLLNSICVNQYEEMKKCRTTMLPSVYRETNKTIYNNQDEKKKILDMNKENNKKIFSGEVKLSNENCKVVENMIPKINNFTELPSNIYMDIYDIPGLNDAETKEIYYKWIEDNFSELDIIVHIIDINSPLNTSDQIDILKMLIKNIHNEKVNNERDVLLLTLVNKCDEMDQNDEGEFEMDDEDQQNYDNIIKTTFEKVKEVTGIESEIHCEFTPISAADTFVYRMLHNNPEVEMDMKLLQKFGVNEVGRRTWNKMDDDERREMITEHFSTGDINETLEITGYNNFTSIMKEYLTKEKQSTILINRIKQELSKEELINKNISTDRCELKKLISIYNSYCSKVWVIDKLYHTNNSYIVTDLINQHISRWINQISDLSNESEDSIKRLQEYKEIISELNETIDAYALLNPVPMKIDETKKKRWSESLGINTDIVYDVCYKSGLTIKNTLNHLFGGYSKLQNEYYLSKLDENNTYNDFPKNIYTNIDSLRENSYDSVESTIDNVISKINTIITQGSWIHTDNSPMSVYYEVDNKNTMIEFCDTLMKLYDYPKEKVIDFLKNFILNRYKVIGLGLENHPQAMYTSYVKAYTILFDNWLMINQELPSNYYTDNEYYNYIHNLYYINKSYLYTSQSLDPTENYYVKKDDILKIPIYLHNLVVDVESGTGSDYSSADEDDIN